MEESRINKGLKRTAGMSLDDIVNACDSDDEQPRSRSSRSRRKKSTVVAAKPPPIAFVAAAVATKPPPVNTSTSASSLVYNDDRKLAAPTTNEGRTLRSSKKDGGGLKGIGGGLKRGGSDDDESPYEYDEEDTPPPPSNKHRRKSSTKSTTQRSTSSRRKKKAKKPNNKTSTKSNNTATATRKSSLNSSHPISLLTAEAKTINDDTLSLRNLQKKGVAAITSDDTGRTRSETHKKVEKEEEDRKGEDVEWRYVNSIQGKTPIFEDIKGHNVITCLQAFLGVKSENRFLPEEVNMLTIVWEAVNEVRNGIAQFKSSSDGFVVNDRDAFLTAASKKRREMKDPKAKDFKDFVEEIIRPLNNYGFSRKSEGDTTTFTKAHFKGGKEGKALAYKFKQTRCKALTKSRLNQKRIWLKYCELNDGHDRKTINAILDPTEAVDCNWAVAAAEVAEEAAQKKAKKVVVFGPISTMPTKELPSGRKLHECRVVGCENYEKDRTCGCCKTHTKLYKQLGSKRVYENGAGYESEDPEEIEDQAASAMTSRSRTARSKKTSYKEDDSDIEEEHSDSEEDMEKKPAAKKKGSRRR